MGLNAGRITIAPNQFGLPPLPRTPTPSNSCGELQHMHLGYLDKLEIPRYS